MKTLLINRNSFFLAISGLYFLVLAFICSNAHAWAPVTDIQKMFLEQDGYFTDTPEKLIEATKSESYYIRYAALNLLTELIGKDAVSVLKQFLNDPHITVRWHTAHLLGTLGDKSGLEQMQKDFEELAEKAEIPLPADPNIEPDTRERLKRERNNALHDALNVAKVLAELGDRRGYKLAAKAAFEETRELHRTMAIDALCEIAKTEKETLEKEKIDPVSVFCKIAETEKNPHVFGRVLSSAAKLPYNEAMRILDKAKVSPNQSLKERNEARNVIFWLKAKKKVEEIKQAEDSGG